ncbi:MAG: alpha/beta fold hydrolase [Alphaproteobacteria bacterium]
MVNPAEGLATLSNGVQLWFWDTGGEGTPIVLAHPHSGNHRTWDAQRPVFEAAGYRVIGYSRRGYYQSTSGPTDDSGAQGTDLGLLLDARGVQSCHLIGSAAGGSTALDFVLTDPDRVLSAVIASSFMSITEPEYQAALARTRGDWFNTLPIEAKELSASFRAMHPDGVAEWLAIYQLNDLGADRSTIRQPLAASINWTTLAANTVPLLLMTGGADLFLPPALLRATAPKVANSEVLIVPDVGHPIFAEAPDIFNRLVLEFIARSA